MPAVIIILLVVFLDQYSKYYAVTHLTSGMSIPVIQDFFHLTLVFNPGAAFGILEHRTGLFIFIAVIMLMMIGYFYSRISPKYVLLRIGTAFMAGGALGNVIDRIRTGYVVDFFDFRIWPVFNIADIAICIGAACIIYSSMTMAHKEDEDFG